MTQNTLTVAAPSLPRSGMLRGLARNPQAVLAGLVLGAIVIVSLLAPWIAPYSASAIDGVNFVAPPSAEHWLGTDTVGRDILSRLIYGGQTNVLGAILAVVLSLVAGLTAGLIAGYFGGWFDSLSSWVSDLVLALPAIIVLLAVNAALGNSVWVSMAVFGLLIAPSNFRLVRATVMAVRNELYVDAARVSGVSSLSIIGRHILAVVRGPLIIQIAMVFGIAIAIQAGLEFLGLGDPLRPSWGLMLNQGFTNIYRYPTLMIAPVVAIVATTLASAVLANGLRDMQGTGEPSPAPASKAREPLAHTAPTDEAAPIVAVRDLRIQYPQGPSNWKTVVDGVSLELRTGEVLGLVGESGSGKTQTAFAILGLLPSNAKIAGGGVYFGPELGTTGDIDRVGYRSILGRQIGYIPQEPMSNLTPSFTIATQLIEPMCRHLGLTKKQAEAKAIELLDRVGIADPVRVMRSYPHEISGGMAQRVLIAGAVSCDPQILIADEPTTALDVTVQAEVLDLLRDLQQERGLAMLLVTHNFGVVADLCDRVAVMRNGTIIEQAPVRQLFNSPQNPYTRMLLDATLDDTEPRPRLEVQVTR